MIKILSFTQYKETYIDRQPNIHSDSDWDFFVALETNQNQIETNQKITNQVDIKPYICDYLTNATLVCFVLFMLF
jgi:hypothetical protein